MNTLSTIMLTLLAVALVGATVYLVIRRLKQRKLEAELTKEKDVALLSMKNNWYKAPGDRVRFHIVNHEIEKVIVGQSEYTSIFNARENEYFSDEEMDFIRDLEHVVQGVQKESRKTLHPPTAFDVVHTLFDEKVYIYRHTADTNNPWFHRNADSNVAIEIIAAPLPEGAKYMPELIIANAWIRKTVDGKTTDFAMNIDTRKDNNDYRKFRYLLDTKQELHDGMVWFKTLEKRIATYNKYRKNIIKTSYGYEVTVPEFEIPEGYLREHDPFQAAKAQVEEATRPREPQHQDEPAPAPQSTAVVAASE